MAQVSFIWGSGNERQQSAEMLRPESVKDSAPDFADIVTPPRAVANDMMIHEWSVHCKQIASKIMRKNPILACNASIDMEDLEQVGMACAWTFYTTGKLAWTSKHQTDAQQQKIINAWRLAVRREMYRACFSAMMRLQTAPGQKKKYYNALSLTQLEEYVQ